MKNIMYVLALCILVVSSCVAPSTPEEAQEQVQQALNETGEVKISLDSVNGEVSTTKNFYFLFDGSGSMDESCSGNRKIDGAREAAYKFLEKVPDNANIGLLAFGTDGQDGCTEMLPLTLNGKNAFRQALATIEPTGGTPLGEAIRKGTDKLVEQYKKQLGYGEYRLIVVTDGNASDYDDMKQACIQMARYPFISLYSIGLCLGDVHDLKSFALSYRDANNYADLQRALEESVAETASYDAGAYNAADYK